MKNQRVLITGCGGMLGEAVYAVASDNYQEVLATDIDLNEEWLDYLDVRDIAQCEQVFADFRPTMVIHLAALTDLEFCETNPQEAWRTNALGTENVGLMAETHDCLMVYVSTAGIFGGEKQVFTEFDTPNPLSEYGKSKYYGELYVENHLSRYFVLRAGWMMGGGLRKDKKFIGKIYKQLQEGTKNLNVVDDKLGTPTYTYNFADAMAKITETKYYGVYNQVCEGKASRFDVADEFIKALGLSNRIKITKVGSDYFANEYFAPRPASEQLDNLKLKLRGINYMKDWRTCLREYSACFKQDYLSSVIT